MVENSAERCADSRGLAAALFYAVCSASMAFINKAVINSYGFNYPFFIMASQMLITIVFLEVLRLFRIVTVEAYTLSAGRSFLLPSLAYGLHSALSLMALSGMNIPMYGVLKRCTPLVNLILSVIVLKKPFPSTLLTTSILVITIGCLVAGLGDLSFNSFAYTVGSLSVVAQGLYLTLVQKFAENKHSTIEILQLNSYNMLPVFVLVSIIAQEPHGIFRYQQLSDGGFLATFAFLAVSGSILNYSLFLCTSVNSALTTSLVGVGKSVVQTTIGFFTFGGVKFHPLNVLGIILNTFGGCLYTYVKYLDGRHKHAKSRKEEEEGLISREKSNKDAYAHSPLKNGLKKVNGITLNGYHLVNGNVLTNGINSKFILTSHENMCGSERHA